MKKKKYLYLLLLLILPIIFFGVAKISLNSGSKTNTEGKILTDDTLAATSYTYYSCKRCISYRIEKKGNYIHHVFKAHHHVKIQNHLMLHFMAKGAHSIIQEIQQE